MVVFNIKCENEEHREKLINELCESLAGSPGFKTNEILVGNEPDNFDVTMIVGLEGRRSISFQVNSEMEIL